MSYVSSKERVICNDKKNEELIYYKLKSKTDVLLNNMVIDYISVKDNVVNNHQNLVKNLDINNPVTKNTDPFLNVLIYDDNKKLLNANSNHEYPHLHSLLINYEALNTTKISVPIYEEKLQSFIGYVISKITFEQKEYIVATPFKYGSYTHLLNPILEMMQNNSSIVSLDIFVTCHDNHRYDIFKSAGSFKNSYETLLKNGEKFSSLTHKNEDKKTLMFSVNNGRLGEAISITSTILLDKSGFKSSLYSLYIDLIISLSVGFIFIIASWIFINKLILNPIKTMQKAVINQELVSSKNLLERKDELALLAGNINNSCQLMKQRILENEQMLLMQDIFVKDSIHEIRTPLSIITLNNDLRDRLYGSDKHSKQINAAIKSLNLVYDDLSFSIEQERNHFEATNINLAILLKERVEYFKTIAEVSHKEIKLLKECDIELFISGKELYRFVDNNLSNAIKYAYPNSQIHIDLKCLDNNIAKLSFITHSPEIKDKEKIFERYVRENNVKGGHGLGLNIIKKISQKYGIKIEITYVEEKNHFTYYIPNTKVQK